MTADGRTAGGRPGCLFGRLLGALVRLALVYPLISISSQLGQAGQRELWPAGGTPYEGALVGAVAGTIIGLILWRNAAWTDGWRPRLAGATLALTTIIWLAAVIGGATGRFTTTDMIAPWAACIAAATVVALLVKR